MTDIKVSMETRLQVNSTEFPHRVGLTMIPSTVVWCVTCFVRECIGIYLVTFSTLHYTFCPIHGVLHNPYTNFCWRPPRLLISIRGPPGSLYQIRSQSYCWLFHKRQMLWQRLLCVRSEVNASHKTPSELNNWVKGCTQCGPRYRNLSVAFGDLEGGRGNPSLLIVQDCIDFQVYWEPIHHHQWQTFHEMIPGESKLELSFLLLDTLPHLQSLGRRCILQSNWHS